MERTLIALVGLPRSGKSTLAKTLGHPIVNKDSIRLAMHGQKFLKEAEPWVHVLAKTMVEALFRAGHDTVTLDECNVTRKRRDEWANSDFWITKFLMVGTPEEVCRQRALEQNDTSLLSVIDRMSENFELLEDDELISDWDERRSL